MIHDDDRPESGESTLARWSRRKREADRPRQARPAEGDDRREPPAPLLTDADMPPLDSLTEASEFSGFLSPGVSAELQRLALRKLFHLPGFSLRDGLDDYDEDFATMTRLAESVTARAGQQMGKHVRTSLPDQTLAADQGQPDPADAEDEEALLAASSPGPDDLAKPTETGTADEEPTES